MEFVYLIIVSIVLYFAAGWILDVFEKWRGKRLKERQAAFLFIFLFMIMAAFYAINRFTG